MSIYSKALRHVDSKDFKKTRQRCLDEQKVLRKIEREKKLQEKKELEEINKLATPLKYDWRKKLNEGMTSSGVFFTSLPSTGDAALFSVDVGNSSSYVYTNDVGYNNGLTINSYGETPYAITKVIDTSTSDSISFTGSSNINFSTSSDLQILWYDNDTGAQGILNGISKTSTSSSTYNVTLPLAARGKNIDFTIFQLRSSSGQDFEGKQISIGGEQVSITSNNSGLIVSLLINYNGTNADAIDWGQQIMSSVSRNTTTIGGVNYPNLFYPGYTAPVSGNAGDPNIDGINATLTTLKTQNSIGYTRGSIGNNTQQQMINLFADTNMDASTLYTDLNAYKTAADLANSYYAQYVNYDIAGNTSQANYYLNLSNQQATIRDTKATAVMSRINSASVLPDSRWTNADFAKVSQDIYNLYKNSSSYNITNFSTKRRTPVNVFVSLDNPEASAFMRTSPMMSKLSPQERQQKLKEMLQASDEYVMKIFGGEFPGTGAAAPGEYDPFEQPPPGEAGDTPGVEIAGLPSGMYPIDPMGGQAPAPKGYKAPGTYDPKQFYQLGPNSLPSPNLPSTPPGLSQGGDQDTQVAWNTPVLPTGPSTPVKYDKFMKQYVPSGRDGFPGNYAPGYLPTASNNKKQSMVASYEPQGEVITEKRKLKSPQEILNRIPGYYDGKPAPLGFPETPPPKMVNGMHPDLVDGKAVSNRFNRLDPESAKATPLTGNPHIDKKVLKARKQPK